MAVFSHELANMFVAFNEAIQPDFDAATVNTLGGHNITEGILPSNGQPGFQCDFTVKRHSDGHVMEVKVVSASVNEVVEETRGIIGDIKHLIDDGELQNAPVADPDVIMAFLI